MTQTLYILNYNNYYNRILKKYNTLQKYLDYSDELYILQDTVFIPNDEVNTEHTFGDTMALYDGKGNYLLVVENNEIISRWFIIDGKRDRMGQWTLTLHRDVLADYYEEVTNAPCFIEKGYIGNIYDPMIFNSENMTYNQIKTNEWSLEDESHTPWLVCYLSNEPLTTSGEGKNDVISVPADVDYDFAASSLSDFEAYINYREDAANCPEVFTNVQWNFHYFENQGETVSFHRIKYTTNFDFIGQDENDDRNTSFSTNTEIEDYKCDTLTTALKTWYSSPEYQTPYPSYVNLSNIEQYNEKVLKIDDGENVKFYRMRKVYKNKNETRACPDGNKTGELYNIYKSWGKVSTNTNVGSRQGIYANVNYTEYYLVFNDITDSFDNITATISNERNLLTDAPYSIITFPLKETTFGGITYNSSEVGLKLAQKMFLTLTNSICYDVQLLPYCCLNNLTELVENGIELSGLTEHKDYDYIYAGENMESIMFYPKTSSFTHLIPFIIQEPTDPLEFKINHECNLYRLCSPNYNGIFEFKTTSNGGLNYFEVNATYKPYTPYIHLNPNFGRLYGQDFNDQRGLILGGDFSIAAMSSAWQNYQLQNKNYQNIFDRQIQNMEINNNMARIQEGFNVVSGTLQGAASGATAGALSGAGPYGAIAGGIIGGVTSLAGGIGDLVINETLRNETLDYTKDMFGYNLGNIKALPNSLTKSSAFDINNKIFPFLEFYTATTEEKEALRDKIKYNGMTIMRTGFLKNIIVTIPKQGYVKGKIIRLDNFEDDYHIANTIGDEVNKGFFIIKEDTV